MRTVSVLAAYCVLLFGGTKPSFGQVTRALLTVDGLSLARDQHLTAFKIDTWGVSLLAVCQIPPSGEMKAQKYMDPAGLLSGRSDLHGPPLKELHEMFLVDVYNYQPLPKGDPKGEFRPASFSGWVEIAKEGSDNLPDTTHGRRRTLHASNFHLSPAAHCPIPPPAGP